MCNEKTACPAGPRTSGNDLGDKENPVCEKTITIQEKSQELQRTLKQDLRIARRAVKIAARVMNADGLCRYDTVDKCRKVWPPDDATCEKCIEKWLLAKARKELKYD